MGQDSDEPSKIVFKRCQRTLGHIQFYPSKRRVSKTSPLFSQVLTFCAAVRPVASNNSMDPKRLSQAATEISKILSDNGVKHGIFGGWAINVLGGERVTKDVDCLAAIGKDELLKLIVKQKGWTAIPNMREDYAALFWDDHLERPVLVEIFIGGSHHSLFRPFTRVNSRLTFSPGSTASPADTASARRAMQAVPTQTKQVDNCSIQILDVFHIFKGKLHAAADRQIFTDVQDLKYLVNTHGQYLRTNAGQINLKVVGRAIKRYPQLADVFSRLQLNILQAQQLQFEEDLRMGPPPFYVQKGIIE